MASLRWRRPCHCGCPENCTCQQQAHEPLLQTTVDDSVADSAEDVCLAAVDEVRHACVCSGCVRRGVADTSDDVSAAVRQYEETGFASFHVHDMSCASCVSVLEHAVGNLQGVTRFTVSLLAERAEVEYDTDIVDTYILLAAFADVGYPAERIESVSAGEMELSVQGMTCASCVATVENVVAAMDGVMEVSVSLLTETAVVHYDSGKTGVRALISVIEELGYVASLKSPGDGVEALRHTQQIGKYRRLLIVSSVFAVPVLIISMILGLALQLPVLETEIVPGLTVEGLVLWILATPVQFYVARGFYVAAWKALRHGAANMDVLVVIGTLAAYFYSVFAIVVAMVNTDFTASIFFETSVLLITFIVLGRYLEAVAKGRTSDALQALMSLQAPTAVLVESFVGHVTGADVDGGETGANGGETDTYNVGTGSSADQSSAQAATCGTQETEREISTGLLQVNDIVKVVPGTQLPADGVVVRGASSVDESMLTGESLPVAKEVGSDVIGGTVNKQGALWVRVSRVGSETVLAQIVKLMEDAQMQKAPIQALADKISAKFVPAVCIVALVTFIVWFTLAMTILPDDWRTPGTDPFLFALLFAIPVLVIACPCALGLATPTAIMVGTGRGAKLGVLIKGGRVLEAARNVSAVIFDKTGTLTHGKPVVTETILNQKHPALLSESAFYMLVAAAESASEHPLGHAIVEYAAMLRPDDVDGSGTNALSVPEDFQAIPGRGLRCHVDLHNIAIGNREWMSENEVEVEVRQNERAAELEAQGNTVVFAAVDGVFAGAIAVADTVRPEASAVVAALQSQFHVECWMVTGDNARTANAVAVQLGLTNVYAEVLPADKATKVQCAQ